LAFAFSIQFNSFIFLHKQVEIKCQRNDKNYIDGEKGHTELVSSSLKLIAGEIGKRRQFFWLPAELRPSRVYFFFNLLLLNWNYCGCLSFFNLKLTIGTIGNYFLKQYATLIHIAAKSPYFPVLVVKQRLLLLYF
jgi:hypothetical protein